MDPQQRSRKILKVFSRSWGTPPPELIETLYDAMKSGTNILDSDHLPNTWRLCVQYGITLDQFANLPMHVMFLGIEKNLMKQTSIIFDRQGSRDEGDSWNQLTTHMANTQRYLSGLSLSWCLSMPFSGPLKCGTANWQSDHCVTFTRSSLIYFAPLDRLYAKSTDSTKRILLAFKSVRVLWFCLVSRIMTDFEVSTCEIDSYIKLFLAACKRFHILQLSG